MTRDRQNSSRPPLVSEARARQKYAHGTHARYVFAHCRCNPCRRARTEYERERTQTRYDAQPWFVCRRGRITADGCKTIRVKNRLTGEIDSRYIIDLLEGSSRKYIPTIAKRRVTFLNKRDGDGAARGAMMVPVKEAREHIARLRRGGMGYKVIARHAGIAPSTICRIVGHKTGYRSIVRTRRDVVDAILGINPSALAGGARVSSAKARRQIAHLIGNGWARSFLASLVQGKQVASMQQLYRPNATMTVRTVARCQAIYGRLHNVRPMFRMTPWGPRPIGKAKTKPAGRASVAQTRELLAAIREADRMIA